MSIYIFDLVPVHQNLNGAIFMSIYIFDLVPIHQNLNGGICMSIYIISSSFMNK
jgi:hypothetical protein